MNELENSEQYLEIIMNIRGIFRNKVKKHLENTICNEKERKKKIYIYHICHLYNEKKRKKRYTDIIYVIYMTYIQVKKEYTNELCYYAIDFSKDFCCRIFIKILSAK